MTTNDAEMYPWQIPRTPLTVGQRVERYTVLEWLGEGAMGVVYGAYDPKLDRRIAIKVLRLQTDRAKDRLLREARSLARVSHPNVIAVYDAGEHEGYIFLAMEYVRGGTMSEWLRREKPHWRTVLARYVDAARGLAAVHAAGLVHRDFKPSNVLFGEDGRVRVTDFGLARMVAPSDETSSSVEQSWLGTPAYVSPEQRECRAVDARSDQYGFCVALYEALYEKPPTPGTTDTEHPSVPARIGHALVRGLSVDPEKRFASMDALIAELSRNPRAQWLRIGAALAAVACVALLAMYARTRPPAPTPCAGAERKLAGVWDDARKQVIREAFLAAKGSYAGDAWNETKRTLDAYAARWIAMHKEACEATRVHGDQSEELMDLRIACLDSRAREVQAQTNLFATGNVRSIERSVQAVEALPSVDGCADVDLLRARVQRPSEPGRRTEVELLQTQVNQAVALERAADWNAAEDAARLLVERVKEVGDRSLESKVHFVLARAHTQRAEWARGEAEYFEAIIAAEAANDETEKGRALAGLVYNLGQQQGRAADVERTAKLAEAVLEHLPKELELRAHLENSLGTFDQQEGRYADSLVRFERARALREADTPDGYRVGVTLYNTASSLRHLGRLPEALEYEQRALSIYERRLGQHHPHVAKALTSIAIVKHYDHHLEEALGDVRRAREIFKDINGPDDREVARTSGIASEILVDMDRLPEALEDAQTALSIMDRRYPLTRDMLSALNSVGLVYIRMGRASDAVDVQERARALCERLGNPSHQTPDVLSRLGAAYVAAGQARKALEPLERSLSLQLKGDPEACDLAETRMLLARALWEAGTDRVRAVALAEQARDAYAAIPRYELERDAAIAWLASRH